MKNRTDAHGRNFAFYELTLELPPNVMNALREMAEKNGMSIYAFLRRIVYETIRAGGYEGRANEEKEALQ